MSSEKRVIRPYKGIYLFQAILDSWSLRIGTQESAGGQNLTVPAASFRADPVVIRTAVDAEAATKALDQLREAASALGIEPTQLEVVVIASNPYLRIVDVVHRRSLADDAALPETLTLKAADGIRALCTPAGGCDITAYFCLADELEPAPLRPHRRGTWLGKVQFALRTELGELGVTPRPLTPEARREHGLDQDAVRLVVVDEEALLSDQINDIVELYVDEALLGHLTMAADSAASRAFQRQLAVDVLATIVWATHRLPDIAQLTVAELEGTVVGRLVDAATGQRDKKESNELYQQRREHQLALLKEHPEVFIANLEARGKPRDDWKSLIGGID
jgi:hypothetical protein